MASYQTSPSTREFLLRKLCVCDRVVGIHMDLESSKPAANGSVLHAEATSLVSWKQVCRVNAEPATNVDLLVLFKENQFLQIHHRQALNFCVLLFVSTADNFFHHP